MTAEALLPILAYHLWSSTLMGDNAPKTSAQRDRMWNPVIGDLVFIHMAGTSDPADQIGTLKTIDHPPLYAEGEWDEEAEGRPAPLDDVYVLETLDGRTVRWSNVSVIALPIKQWSNMDSVDLATGETRALTLREQIDSLFRARASRG